VRCETALDRMLEAEPAELRGDADTELTRHTAGCGRCSAVAAALLAQADAVDAAISEYAAAVAGVTEAERTTAARVAADAALTAIVAEQGKGFGPGRAPARGRARGHRWTRAAWIPLAAAAALAGVLVLGRSPRPFPDQGPALSDPRPPGPAVSVHPPADRGTAVLETRNPDITIVWQYEREES